MSKYEALVRPTKEQSEALQFSVKSLSQDIQRDYLARALIETGQVQVTGVPPQSLLSRRLDVADLLKGQVPSRYLGPSMDGPSFGPGM